MNKIKKLMITLVALLAVTLFTGLSASAQNLTLKLSDALYDEENYTYYAYPDGDQSIAEGTYVQINMSTYHTQVMNIYMNGEVVYTKPSGAVYTNDVYHFTAGPNCKILGGNSNRFDWNSNPNIRITMDAPSSASAVTVAWTAAKKTGTFTMPGGNVTLEPEYYPQATLAFQGLTAAEDAAAKTEAPLAVLAENAVYGGTLMYYVAPDKNFSQADAIALAETQWSADIPTAETIDAAGTCYVWYYIKGDAEHSDTDPKPLAVTVLPEPTYAVTFAEGTDANEWTADPNAGVTKGQTVTVTYTGTKKVIGVKAEKKAAAPAGPITVTWNSNDITGSGKSFTKDGVTLTAGFIDFDQKIFMSGGTFTTTLGNFTKIEVTADSWGASGTGWSGKTWTGNASSVSYDGDIMGMVKVVFTIEPTN